MRKTILLLCACLCCTVAVLAQNVQGVRQGKERTCILDDELKYIKDLPRNMPISTSRIASITPKKTKSSTKSVI